MTAGHDDDEPAGVPIDAFPMPAGYHSVAEARLYRRAYFEDAVTQLGYIPSADAMLEYVAVHRAAEAVQALQRARDWASRRCILGVLAIQRVDGPIIGDVDSPQQFKLLPWTTLRVFRRRNAANNGCFSRLPAGAAAGRRRATEILVGGGTRA